MTTMRNGYHNHKACNKANVRRHLRGGARAAARREIRGEMGN